MANRAVAGLWGRAGALAVALAATLAAVVVPGGVGAATTAAVPAPDAPLPSPEVPVPVPPPDQAGVPYGTTADAATVLDVYLPPTGPDTGRPAILTVHGGGWVGGERAWVAGDAWAFAQAGFVTFNIGYRVGGPDRWPTELFDVQQALRWVQANASTYGVDPARIGLFGSSAGGNLVLLVGTTDGGDPTRPRVRAVASWSGPTDLVALAPGDVPGTRLADPGQAPLDVGASPAGCRDDPAEPGCIPVLSPSYVRTYLGCSFARCPDTYRAASPVFHVTAAAPATFLASAQIDLVPVSQAYEMANALNEAGVRSVLQLVPGIGHADGYRTAALGNTTGFFTEQLGPGATSAVPPRSPPTTAAGSASLPPLEDGWAIPAPAPGGGGPPLPAWLWVAAALAALALIVALALVVRRDLATRR